MDQTRPLFTSYLRIRSLSTAHTSPELAAARADLEAALATLAEDLADLVASVRAVEADPARFGLSAHEVARRKRLVQEIGGEVEDMREELRNRTGGGGAAAAAAAVLNNNKKGGAGAGAGTTRKVSSSSSSGGNADLPDPNAFAMTGSDDGYDDNGRGGHDEDYAAEFEQQQQVAMMREQDQHLDGVFQTVDNLRRQAGDMGRELEEQREMLEVTDALADRVGGRLQNGMDKLRYVVQHNEDRLSSWCIGLLILVLCILLVLLLIL